MGSKEDGERTPSGRLPEMMVRTLRHEVGDLLQSVYSAVAILQARLPSGQTLERTILTDLRGRAETCRNELDATHDLVCPLTLNREWTDLSELASSVTASFSLRHPGLHVVCEASRPLKVWVDAPRLAQVGTLLISSLCQAARKEVVVRTLNQEANGSAEWSLSHDGPAPTQEQLSWLTAPFNTTRHAHFGLALAFASAPSSCTGDASRPALRRREVFRSFSFCHLVNRPCERAWQTLAVGENAAIVLSSVPTDSSKKAGFRLTEAPIPVKVEGTLIRSSLPHSVGRGCLSAFKLLSPSWRERDRHVVCA